NDGLAGTVEVGEHHQHLGAAGRQRGDLGTVVRLAVLVGLVAGHGSADRGKGGAERVVEALAVIVVHVRYRHPLDAAFAQYVRKHLALASVGRGGAEHEVVVVKAGDGRRRRRRRNHDHVVGYGRAVGRG